MYIVGRYSLILQSTLPEECKEDEFKIRHFHSSSGPFMGLYAKNGVSSLKGMFRSNLKSTCFLNKMKIICSQILWTLILGAKLPKPPENTLYSYKPRCRLDKYQVRWKTFRFCLKYNVQ